MKPGQWPTVLGARACRIVSTTGAHRSTTTGRPGAGCSRNISQSWPDRPSTSHASRSGRSSGAAGFERLAYRVRSDDASAAPRLEQQLELHGGDGQLVVRVVQTGRAAPPRQHCHAWFSPDLSEPPGQAVAARWRPAAGGAAAARPTAARRGGIPSRLPRFDGSLQRDRELPRTPRRRTPGSVVGIAESSRQPFARSARDVQLRGRRPASRLGYHRVHAPARDPTVASASRRLDRVSRGPRARLELAAGRRRGHSEVMTPRRFRDTADDAVRADKMCGAASSSSVTSVDRGDRPTRYPRAERRRPSQARSGRAPASCYPDHSLSQRHVSFLTRPMRYLSGERIQFSRGRCARILRGTPAMRFAPSDVSST